MCLVKYETVYILKSELAEDALLRVIDHYQGILAERGAKNLQVENRGKRHLRYPIKKSRDGVYVQMEYEGNGDMLELLTKSMRIDESVLRYMTVKVTI